jgi:hypothetical protein
MAAIRCDSCGRDEPADDVLAVHRAYVTPAAWDQEERVDVQAEVERWCFACRSHYPHQEVGAAEPEL